jgi:tetratricopeptide (TPR) repeat protein
LERGGDDNGATAAYREVLQLDSASDEAWIRIGILACKKDSSTAEHAFKQAARLRPESAALFRAEAHCSLLHRDFDRAQAAAGAALRLAPTDPELSQLLIQVHLTRGQREEALRLAWSHAAVFPDDTNGWLTLATLVKDPPSLQTQLQRRATQRAPEGRRYAVASPGADSSRLPAVVDMSSKWRLELEHALITGHARNAQHAARELQIGTLELARKARELGAFEFARNQVDLAGAILPDDSRIWQDRLELADLLGDEAGFEQLLRQPPRTHQVTSPREWSTLAEIVRKRTGVVLRLTTR